MKDTPPLPFSRRTTDRLPRLLTQQVAAEQTIVRIKPGLRRLH